MPKQQPAAPVQAHFPPHIQVPTAPQVRFKQPPPQAMARPQPPGWEPDPEPPRGPSAKQQPPSPASFLQPPTHGPRVCELWQQSPPPRLPKQPPPPPSHMQLPWQPEGPPPVVPVGTNLSAGPGVGNMNSRPSFVLPQGIELRHIQSSTVLGGVAMRCACQDHEFFMVVPLTTSATMRCVPSSTLPVVMVTKPSPAQACQRMQCKSCSSISRGFSSLAPQSPPSNGENRRISGC